MKHLIVALSLALAAGASFARTAHAPAAASAATPTTVAADGATPPATSQQSKMKSCNRRRQDQGHPRRRPPRIHEAVPLGQGQARDGVLSAR